jgi:hypothetical protein
MLVVRGLYLFTSSCDITRPVLSYSILKPPGGSHRETTSNRTRISNDLDVASSGLHFENIPNETDWPESRPYRSKYEFGIGSNISCPNTVTEDKDMS